MFNLSLLVVCVQLKPHPPNMVHIIYDSVVYESDASVIYLDFGTPSVFLVSPTKQGI